MIMEVIQFYADANNDINIDDDDDDQVLASKDDYTFIDDSEQNGNNVDFYRGFENVTRDLNERTMKIISSKEIFSMKIN